MTKQNANPTVYRVDRRQRSDSMGSSSLLSSPSYHLLGSSSKKKRPPPSSLTTEAAAESVDAAMLRDEDEDEDDREPITSAEVFDLIRHLNDPEHPLTLEQLKVATLENVRVEDERSSVDICFTPTIPHCSMATLIGLCIRVKLLRSLPKRFKVRVSVTPGTHASEAAVNKQLNDKERVAAALENAHLLSVVNKCLQESAAATQSNEGA